MNYQSHRKFLKAYRKLPPKLKDAVKRRLALFAKDPFAQELYNHALSGKYEGYRSISITGDYRAIYKEISKEEVIFMLIGTHTRLYG